MPQYLESEKRESAMVDCKFNQVRHFRASGLVLSEIRSHKGIINANDRLKSWSCR